MILLILTIIFILILEFSDEDFFIPVAWYAVTILIVTFISGCSSIPPTPYDNDPIIWIE